MDASLRSNGDERAMQVKNKVMGLEVALGCIGRTYDRQWSREFKELKEKLKHGEEVKNEEKR
jgi:hypothetical protein